MSNWIKGLARFGERLPHKYYGLSEHKKVLMLIEKDNLIAAMEGNIDTLKAGLKNRDDRIAELEKAAEAAEAYVGADFVTVFQAKDNLLEALKAAGYLGLTDGT